MTVKEWLEGLVTSNQSTEKDSVMMQNILHKVGFSGAVCTCGIVYLEGKGTREAPPTSINATAQMILKATNK